MFDEDLYLSSIAHRDSHKCGGYPFDHGEFLNKIVKAINAKRILEIGTAIGYSAICLAKNNDTSVLTIDQNGEHESIAIENFVKNGVAGQIEMRIGNSKDIFSDLNEQFDLIFVDGFEPDPTEINEYIKLMVDQGLLISTNHSWNNSTKLFMKKIKENKLETFLNFDTAFSSKDGEKVKTCIDIWDQIG